MMERRWCRAVEELTRDRSALSLVEGNREIGERRRPTAGVLFAIEPGRKRKRLIMNEFLFDWETSVPVSPHREINRVSEIPVRKLMKTAFSRNRENGVIVKICCISRKIAYSRRRETGDYHESRRVA